MGFGREPATGLQCISSDETGNLRSAAFFVSTLQKMVILSKQGACNLVAVGNAQQFYIPARSKSRHRPRNLPNWAKLFSGQASLALNLSHPRSSSKQLLDRSPSGMLRIPLKTPKVYDQIRSSSDLVPCFLYGSRNDAPLFSCVGCFRFDLQRAKPSSEFCLYYRTSKVTRTQCLV